MNLVEMNLKDKLDKVFGAFSLKSPNPKQAHKWHLVHLHADFYELKCLLWARDSYVTESDLITHYKDFGVPVEDGEESEKVIASEVSEINDKWNSRFVEIFDVIEEREIIYAEDYPFELNKNKIRLKKDLTWKHRVYIYLLLASSLDNFKALNSILTSEFESMSKSVLETYLVGSKVLELGANSHYEGNTRSKIKQLAEALNLDYRYKTLEAIPIQASKEKGLDLIAYLPFVDMISNMIVVLGQCACGKDWKSKKAETEIYEHSYLDFNKLKPIHSMFIPYGLSKLDDNLEESFHELDQTNGRLLFERKRILECIHDERQVQDLTMEIVDRCVEAEFVEV